jgi:hypothetical protein
MGAKHGISLISATTSKGHMRFMIKESGGVNADVFIVFLKRHLIGAKRKIFLIVDRGPAHRARKTRAFVETLGGKSHAHTWFGSVIATPRKRYGHILCPGAAWLAPGRGTGASIPITRISG